LLHLFTIGDTGFIRAFKKKKIEMDVALVYQRLIRIERDSHTRDLIHNTSTRLNSRFALITRYMTASCFSPRIFARTGSERTQIILFPLAQGTRIVITRFRERACLVRCVQQQRILQCERVYVLITLLGYT